MNAKLWAMASVVTLVSVGIGLLAGYELERKKTVAGLGFVASALPSCTSNSGNAQTDYSRGDVAVPERQSSTADLNRIVCFGDKLRWHDQHQRRLAVHFYSNDCTGGTDYSSTDNGFESIVSAKTVSNSNSAILHCKYDLTVTNSSGPPDQYLDPHLIVMK